MTFFLFQIIPCTTIQRNTTLRNTFQCEHFRTFFLKIKKNKHAY